MKDPIFSRINAAKVESTPHTNSERIKKGDSFSSLSFLITCNRRTTAGITAARVSMVLMDGKNKNNWINSYPIKHIFNNKFFSFSIVIGTF